MAASMFLVFFQDSGIGSEKGDKGVSGKKADSSNKDDSIKGVEFVDLAGANNKVEKASRVGSRASKASSSLKKLQSVKIRRCQRRSSTAKLSETSAVETNTANCSSNNRYLLRRINLNNSAHVLSRSRWGKSPSPAHVSRNSPIREVPRSITRSWKTAGNVSPQRTLTKSLSPKRMSAKSHSPRRNSTNNHIPQWKPVKRISPRQKFASSPRRASVDETCRTLRPRVTPSADTNSSTLSQCKKRDCYLAFLEDTVQMTIPKRQCRHTVG